MVNLDELQNIAVNALIAFHNAMHSTLREPNWTEHVSDLGRQYVTAQARYTNALRDLEATW